MKNVLIILAALLSVAASCNNTSEKMVVLKTTAGDIKVKLYEDTPKHTENFIKLVEEGFYDSLLFHRIIKDFMIQAGDPKSKNADAGQALGEGGPGYQIEAEIMPDKHIHKKGALAAARQDDKVNPERKSSGSQFYIVQGQTYNDEQLDQFEEQKNQPAKQKIAKAYFQEHPEMEQQLQKFRQERNRPGFDSLVDIINTEIEARFEGQPHFSYTDAQREIYKTQGGTPHLDGAYTVFGEVVKGMDVIDKIAATETGQADRPKEDVRILEAKVLK